MQLHARCCAGLRTAPPPTAHPRLPLQHFGPCGGCTLQSLAYEAQLAAKQRQVADLLSRTAGVPDVAAVLRFPVGCPPTERLGYRNKMEFSFSSQVWHPGLEPGSSSASTGGGRRGSPPRSSAGARSRGGTSAGSAFALGLHRPGSTYEVLPISRCHLQSDAASALLQRILALCQQAGLRPYDARTRRGLLQDVVIRRGTHSSLGDSGGGGDSDGRDACEYLVNFVTAMDGREALAPVAAALMQPAPAPAAAAAAAASLGAGAGGASLPPAPAVVGVVNSVLQRGRPAGERRLAAEHVLAGRGSLTETLCGVEFEASRGRGLGAQASAQCQWLFVCTGEEQAAAGGGAACTSPTGAGPPFETGREPAARQAHPFRSCRPCRCQPTASSRQTRARRRCCTGWWARRQVGVAGGGRPRRACMRPMLPSLQGQAAPARPAGGGAGARTVG